MDTQYDILVLIGRRSKKERKCMKEEEKDEGKEKNWEGEREREKIIRASMK